MLSIGRSKRAIVTIVIRELVLIFLMTLIILSLVVRILKIRVAFRDGLILVKAISLFNWSFIWRALALNDHASPIDLIMF